MMVFVLKSFKTKGKKMIKTAKSGLECSYTKCGLKVSQRVFSETLIR